MKLANSRLSNHVLSTEDFDWFRGVPSQIAISSWTCHFVKELDPLDRYNNLCINCSAILLNDLIRAEIIFYVTLNLRHLFKQEDMFLRSLQMFIHEFMHIISSTLDPLDDIEDPLIDQQSP